MEVTFNARIATATVADKSYYASPIEEIIQFDQHIIDDVGECINNIIKEVELILNCIALKDNLKYNESSAEFRPKTTSRKLSGILRNIQYHFLRTGIVYIVPGYIWYTQEQEVILCAKLSRGENKDFCLFCL